MFIQIFPHSCHRSVHSRFRWIPCPANYKQKKNSNTHFFFFFCEQVQWQICVFALGRCLQPVFFFPPRQVSVLPSTLLIYFFSLPLRLTRLFLVRLRHNTLVGLRGKQMENDQRGFFHIHSASETFQRGKIIPTAGKRSTKAVKTHHLAKLLSPNKHTLFDCAIHQDRGSNMWTWGNTWGCKLGLSNAVFTLQRMLCHFTAWWIKSSFHNGLFFLY